MAAISGDRIPFAPVGCSAALFSQDGMYRYQLSRRWSRGPTVTWVMLNPSTADASRDDPTIRRCIGFSKGWAMGALSVVNLYAYRATNPRELVEAAGAGVDPVGPHNWEAVHDAVVRSRLVVAAWGDKGGEQALVVEELVNREIGRDLWCLGTTKAGNPRHPLRLPGDTAPVHYSTVDEGRVRHS